jgi:hypothetical protein
MWGDGSHSTKEDTMVNTSKVAAVATTVALALTPAAALASTHPGAKKKSAKATCTALDKKMGAKKFKAKYGTGTKHTGAMTHCIKLHTKAKTTTKKK